MTKPTTAPRRLAAIAVLVAVALTPAGPLAAQSGPPAPPRDSQPALRPPVAPSRPPASMAPRARPALQEAPAARDTTTMLIKRVSAPVDSARPAPAPAIALDPSRAPAVTPPPSPRAAAAVQLVTPRAAMTSDTPPAGTTARCKDGTYLTGPLDDNSCSDHGGLTVRIPQAPPPQAPRRLNP